MKRIRVAASGARVRGSFGIGVGPALARELRWGSAIAYETAVLHNRTSGNTHTSGCTQWVHLERWVRGLEDGISVDI